MFGLNVNINTCNFNLIPKLEPCFLEQTLGLRWLLRLGWPTTVEVMLCSCWEIQEPLQAEWHRHLFFLHLSNCFWKPHKRTLAFPGFPSGRPWNLTHEVGPWSWTNPISGEKLFGYEIVRRQQRPKSKSINHLLVFESQTQPKLYHGNAACVCICHNRLPKAVPWRSWRQRLMLYWRLYCKPSIFHIFQGCPPTVAGP